MNKMNCVVVSASFVSLTVARVPALAGGEVPVLEAHDCIDSNKSSRNNAQRPHLQTIFKNALVNGVDDMSAIDNGIQKQGRAIFPGREDVALITIATPLEDDKNEARSKLRGYWSTASEDITKSLKSVYTSQVADITLKLFCGK